MIPSVDERTKRPADDIAATSAALVRIAEGGSDLTRPMAMDFFVAVPSAEAGRIVAARAVALGFSSTVERDEETRSWICYCTKTLIPELFTVAAIERQLDRLAQEVGGWIDGFGSYGNADAHRQ